MTSTDDLAPYPKSAEEATADHLARHMAVEAHRNATLNTPRHQLMMASQATGENYADKLDLYMLNQALMTAEFGVAFLLRELQRLAPAQADKVAARLWDMWEDAPLQAITWDALESYGIDPEQVSDAALARWEAATKPSAPAPLAVPSLPSWDDGTCGDCATGKCHGTEPDDCGCARHDASVTDLDDELCIGCGEAHGNQGCAAIFH